MFQIVFHFCLQSNNLNFNDQMIRDDELHKIHVQNRIFFSIGKFFVYIISIRTSFMMNQTPINLIKITGNK